MLGCSARKFQVGTFGVRCMHAVGEIKFKMTSFAVP